MCKFTKRLLSLLVVIAMVVAMAPATGLPVAEVKAEATSTTNLPDGVQEKIDDAAEIAKLDPATVVAGTTCPMCGAEGITWVQVSAGNQTVAGHYYITGDLVNNATGSATYRLFEAPANGTMCVALVDANVSWAGPFVIGNAKSFGIASYTGNVFYGKTCGIYFNNISIKSSDVCFPLVEIDITGLSRSAIFAKKGNLFDRFGV